MLKEFREFAIKGNAVDIAIGVVLAAAFGAIVNSLVKDVIMPPIGLVLGKTDFSNLFVIVKAGSLPGPYPSLAAAQASGAVTVNYGTFLNTIITFVIVAFSIFLVVKLMNRLRRPEEVATKDCPYCLSSIPIAATRCSACTSHLDAEPTAG